MKAKYIKEENVFKLKSKDNIISDFINIDTAMPIVEAINSVMEGIPLKTFSYEEMKDIINQLTQMATSYYIDIYLEDLGVNESIENILRPKSKEDILRNLRDTSYKEYELKDGKYVWIYEDSFHDMGGERVFFYSLVDENGNTEILTNDSLEKYPFYMDDRIELVKMIDNMNAVNDDAANAYVDKYKNNF